MLWLPVGQICFLKIERNHQNQCKYKKNRHIRIRNQSFRTRSIIFFFTNSWKWGLEKQCNLRYCLVIAFLYTLHGSLCNVSVRSNKDLCDYKWILYLTTMYVFCVYPAMSKKSENFRFRQKGQASFLAFHKCCQGCLLRGPRYISTSCILVCALCCT
jgi:hypothetical protein